MRQLIPVKGNSSLARDPKTGAILNINRTEIGQARERKALRQNSIKEVEQLKSDVSDLKSEIGDIKQLLVQLIERQ